METAQIANVLGGRKVLGKTVKRPDELAELVRKGLPASSVTALAGKLRRGHCGSFAQAWNSAAHDDSPSEPALPADRRRIGQDGAPCARFCACGQMIAMSKRR